MEEKLRYCQHCGKQFNYKNKNKKFCNNRCAVDQYRQTNLEKIQAKDRKYSRSYKKAHPDHNSQWVSANKDKRSATAARRYKRLTDATPSWLSDFDKDYIKNIYLQAKELTKITGIKHHTDHIVALQGKHVSGLHVPWNLRVITATENLKKNNKSV